MSLMLEELYEAFKFAKTTKGKPVFKEGMKQAIIALKGHIADGCLCDKPGFA